jgi:hypothetical protein
MRDVQTPMVGTDLSELKGKILDFLRQDRTTRPNLGNVNNLYEVIRYYATRTNKLVGVLGGGDEDDTDETPPHSRHPRHPRRPRSSSVGALASVGSKKPRTGHLVEDLFFEDVIVFEIDGQISSQNPKISAKFRRSLLLLFIQQRTRHEGRPNTHGGY